MKPDILRFIACPECNKPLQMAGDDLSCSSGHHFPVINGVPCLLTDMDEKQKATAISFGDKWAGVPNYGYEEKTRDFHRKWYLERYGWRDEIELGEALSDAYMILDAGCGIGRDVAWYEEHTISTIIGFDIGASVWIANDKLDGLPCAHILQADIMKPPFSPAQFDFIASDFVLHHTPDTRKALSKLVDILKPGGMISFYVYAKKGEVREACDDMLREYTTKMSHEDCMKFSEAVMQFGKAVSEIDLEFQRMIYWDIMKCFWNPDFTVAQNISVNYDWYKPAYAWRHEPYEVRWWCEQMGIEIIHMDQQQSGISVRGIKK